MTREEMVELVIESLRESLRMSGREVICDVAEATVPIGGLRDFDSLNGIEVTQALEERLGVPLADSLFMDDGGGRARSVGDVADHLMRLMSPGVGA